MRAAWCGVLLLLAAPAGAKPMMVQDFPIARLKKNLDARIARAPNDPHNYYVLGRLYAFAFYQGSEKKVRLVMGPDHSRNKIPYGQPRCPAKALTPARIAQMKAALAAFRKALALSEGKKPAYGVAARLGLAWVLEYGALAAPKVGGEKADDWTVRALKHYRACYAAARPGDLKAPTYSGFRTPGSLRALLEPSREVRFDLDGDGAARRWPWVRPDTVILVWDPRGAGKITSGRQLFGNVTWWIFWPTGYGPLAALDDDGDGWLAGAELKGLAGWRDANGNGVSDPGEVRPLSALGVRRIAARSNGRHQGVAAHTHGVELAGGERLPTYDWTPTSR